MVVPVSLTSALVTVVSGLTLVRFGCGIREPVTTSSWTVDPLEPPEASGLAVGDTPGTGPAAPAAWAKALVETDTRANPVIIDVARS